MFVPVCNLSSLDAANRSASVKFLTPCKIFFPFKNEIKFMNVVSIIINEIKHKLY